MFIAALSHNTLCSLDRRCFLHCGEDTKDVGADFAAMLRLPRAIDHWSGAGLLRFDCGVGPSLGPGPGAQFDWPLLFDHVIGPTEFK